MDKIELVNKLQSLIKLDIDAVRSYDQAIERITDVDIRRQLEIFREDHSRHVDVITNLVRSYGEVPTSASPDLKGFFLEGFTAIQSMMGTEAALKAMRTNEKETNRQYADAQSLDLPADVLRVLEKNYADERRHLEYVDLALAEKKWELSHV